jgi:hypothetical protein
VCEIFPLDLVETIRADPLEPDPAVRFAHYSCGSTFTVIVEDTPRDEEGRNEPQSKTPI